MKIDESVFDKLNEAKQADGVFVTITTLNGGVLNHYQYHKNLPKADLIPSLTEIEKLVRRTMT